MLANLVLVACPNKTTAIYVDLRQVHPGTCARCGERLQHPRNAN